MDCSILDLVLHWCVVLVTVCTRDPLVDHLEATTRYFLLVSPEYILFALDVVRTGF